MDDPSDTPLQVGERVIIRDFVSCASGIIIDSLSHDYVLVQWSDHPIPMSHRRFSLKRAAVTETAIR
jgi:hypothetical protein